MAKKSTKTPIDSWIEQATNYADTGDPYEKKSQKKKRGKSSDNDRQSA
jgi:hypothetical protein